MAPEGRPFVLAGLLLAAVLLLTGLGLSAGGDGAAGRWLSPLFWSRTMLWLAAGALVLTAFTMFFFRNPRRTPPDDPGAVVAPGDGRVVQITELREDTFLNGPSTRISIFLSIFDVHVQRAPVSGTVALRGYRPGGFAVAWDPRASEANEQASLGIQAGPHRLLVRQIAGLVARRVVTDPEEGASVKRGERIGLIRFGSRVDLFLPPGFEMTCSRGDRVRAGETVVARLADRDQEGRTE